MGLRSYQTSNDHVEELSTSPSEQVVKSLSKGNKVPSYLADAARYVIDNMEKDSPHSVTYHKLDYANQSIGSAIDDVDCSFCRSHLKVIQKGIEHAMEIQDFNDHNTTDDIENYRQLLQNNAVLWILSTLARIMMRIKMFRAKLFRIFHMNK